MGVTRMAGVAAAHFGRDLEIGASPWIATIIDDARRDGVALLVLPDASLGGYLSTCATPTREPPPALDPEARAAGWPAPPATWSCASASARPPADPLQLGGLPQRRRGARPHRKVHQPAGESAVYAAGDRFVAFDTPVGRIGMLIDYDKTFPESARTLAARRRRDPGVPVGLAGEHHRRAPR